MTAHSLACQLLSSVGPWSAWLALSVAVGTVSLPGHAAEPPSAVAAAHALLRATPEAARAQLELPFTDPVRSDWHYIPRTRSGLAWRALSTAQRAALTRLIESAL